MNLFSDHKSSSIFVAVFVVFSFVAVYGVHSMQPYVSDPEIKALGAMKDQLKVAAEAELKGDALRDKVLADPSSKEKGKARFHMTCAAYCHGHMGSGTEAPLQCQVEHTPEYVFTIISEGRRIMPAWSDAFNETERWELVAFILSLKDLPKCKE